MKIKPISEGHLYMAQRVVFELDGLRIVNAEILRSDKKIELDMEIYEHYSKQLIEAYAAKEILLRELKEIYFPNEDGVVDVDFVKEVIRLSDGCGCENGACSL